MLQLLRSVKLKTPSTRWEWQLEKDRRFSVKSLYSSQIDNSGDVLVVFGLDLHLREPSAFL
ncbi:hypothetical protein Dimus_036055, partial [Dionaea muscipula]